MKEFYHFDMHQKHTRDCTLLGKVGQSPTTITVCISQNKIDSLNSIEEFNYFPPDIQKRTPPKEEMQKSTHTQTSTNSCHNVLKSKSSQ